VTHDHETTSHIRINAPGGPTLAQRVKSRAARWLARHSIDILRISLGLVFLVFGALKFFPNVSPAQELAVRTLDTLSLGILSGDAARYVTALVESFIGITLVSGRLLKVGLLVLGAAMMGILSPLVLFFTDLFPGAPTLEAQYVLKDFVLVAAGLVVAARALGAQLLVRSGPIHDERS
jgi:putative oxidoreductase